MVQKPTPHDSAVAKTHGGPLLLAALCLLFGTSCSFSGEPLFADMPASSSRESLFSENPASRSATNSLPAGLATNGGPQLNAAGSITQGGTNSASRISTNSMDASDDQYRLAIGDRISFRIEEDENDPMPLTVRDSGDLEVPYIGHYPAVGKTCKELAQALKVELEKTYYYQATVIISVDLMTKSRGKVYLVGPVRMPGPEDIPSDEVLTLSKAILRAGGFTDFADQHHVKITRQGGTGEIDKETLVVDVGQIFDKGKTENDVPLKPGDLIYIPERMIRF
ncbi:MAG TPA: polysaccharide biosynthesis/export family protein [Verrucomicrobiae bacterium]|nr:polysaccharide biosynthesis/export family protein [Verrucomicrobiae bacterium]